MAMVSLDSLSTELLLKIFKYMDVNTLCKLRQTCKRFNEIIDSWEHIFLKHSKPLVTNQLHQEIIDRSARLLQPIERMRISKNWRRGVFQDKSILSSKTKYIPWIQLDKDLLWLSRGRLIRAYRRTRKGIDVTKAIYTLKGKTGGEVCRFSLKNNCIVSGQADGSLWLWSKNENRYLFNLTNCHDADINSVDMNNDVMISGSRDNYVKIWKRQEDLTSEDKCFTIDLSDRVWSVALADANVGLVAIGTAGISYTTTLTIVDILNKKFLTSLGIGRFGAGILDIKWESPSVLWSCGYDYHIRRWDLRTGECEQAFEDPCDAAVYCFQYDNVNTIISGTQSNGRAVLWDTRTENYIQMYFMESCRRREKSSPVYGLCFDAEYLFTATDQHLNILDFSVYSGKFRDYSNLFLKIIKN